MREEQLERFIRLIAARTGLTLGTAERQGLRQVLLDRMSSGDFREPEAYLALLQQESPAGRAEWLALAPLLTTGESYFFRDRGQFDLLRRRLLPDLIAARSFCRRLRIWSAGCSSGEEPYSLAILLRELLPQWEEWQILVLGTDFNEQALARARRGRFTAWSFRGVDPELRRRYFAPVGEEWLLDEAIRRMVVFRQGNLVADHFPDAAQNLHDLDLILCRNTFIYFSPETVAAVVEKFAATLTADGYLMTGHGELQLQGLRHVHLQLRDEQVVFRKRDPAAANVLPEAAPSSRRPHPPLPASPRRPLPCRPPAIARPAVPGRNQAGSPPSRHDGATLAAAEAALAAGNPVEGIAMAEAMLGARPDSVAVLKFLARAHADRGNYQQAGHFCLRALDLAATDPAIHFLLAQLAEAVGDLATAREALEKTLYLDPGSIAALIELGHLCCVGGDARRGASLFVLARERLASLRREAVVPEFPGLTAGELIRHLEQQLASA